MHGAQLFDLEAPESILRVVSESLINAHVSARSMRLRCIEIILERLCYSLKTESSEDDHSTAYAAIIRAADASFGEALICLKDSNLKTREASKAVLTLFVESMTVQDSLMRLCAAIVAETASMRSAAVLGLCLLYMKRRNDPMVLSSMPELLDTTCLLLSEESTELSRAVLTSIKVSCAVLPTSQLHQIVTTHP